MDVKEQVISLYNAHKDDSRSDIINFALDVEFGDYSETLAAHTLLMMSSDRASETDGTMALDKHAEWMTNKANGFRDDFPYEVTMAALDKMLAAEKYDADAMVTFMMCFTQDDLKMVGI